MFVIFWNWHSTVLEYEDFWKQTQVRGFTWPTYKMHWSKIRLIFPDSCDINSNEVNWIKMKKIRRKKNPPAPEINTIPHWIWYETTLNKIRDRLKEIRKHVWKICKQIMKNPQVVPVCRAVAREPQHFKAALVAAASYTISEN